LFEQMPRRHVIMGTFRTCGVDNDSDAALVSATKRGDARAFDKLALRHKRRVLAVAHRITNNREDAEDVAQESFHKAYLHLHDFQERSLFSTWLTRIAMYQAFMLLRRRRRALEVMPESSGDDVKPVSETFIDQSPNPEESCWRRERIEHLATAINRLSPTIRRTILLRDIEERSVEETAQILGASISAVKARVFQGRRKLRGTINPGLLRGAYKDGRAEAQHC
ncbi:MAG TPA: sigma-70 family RNA polymerase sigma factor, partial [Anaerolineales bacterium]|nr:sigma-70 family RNA polymerase sigma factor [Anaerolineales bacterium]